MTRIQQIKLKILVSVTHYQTIFKFNQKQARMIADMLGSSRALESLGFPLSGSFAKVDGLRYVGVPKFHLSGVFLIPQLLVTADGIRLLVA